ncbi:hypothetical protein B296_00039375 [Ensete ventricosum]|uniref:Uncharacterized protein n=1 Tax=Ensete ventricosum TaxID=4639 RepID=A0A426Z4J3_ENSVE|nr:hypothetical protein B296_00039375 [Ensete ventricosum]
MTTTTTTTTYFPPPHPTPPPSEILKRGRRKRVHFFSIPVLLPSQRLADTHRRPFERGNAIVGWVPAAGVVSHSNRVTPFTRPSVHGVGIVVLHKRTIEMADSSCDPTNPLCITRSQLAGPPHLLHRVPKEREREREREASNKNTTDAVASRPAATHRAISYDGVSF